MKAKKPAAKGYSSKPANQGSAGKANVQQPANQNKKASIKSGAVMFTKQPSGTRGSKNK